MSEHLEEQDGLIRREYAADLTPGEGRTVDCRIVPYGERITHNDGLGGVPKGQPYEEEWAPGCFTHQLNAANRVLANFEHQDGLAGVVGHGTALIEREDGLYGSFKMHPGPDGDKALMLIQEGVLNSVSLEANNRRSIRDAAGVIRRVKANLRNVAFSRFGAYKNAVVLAVREPAVLIDEELLPYDLDPAIVERVRRLGVELPERYKAPLADTGTAA